MEKTLPKNWILSNIGELLDVNMGQSPPSSSYNTEGIGIPFMQGKTEFGDLYPEIRKYTTDPKKTVKTETVLLSVRAPIGPTNISQAELCIGRGLAGLSSDILPLNFLLYYLRSIENVLDAKGTGTTFKAISKDKLLGTNFPLPPLSEQQRIVTKLDLLFKHVEILKTRLNTIPQLLKNFRQAVLTQAVTGKLTEEWRVGKELESASKWRRNIIEERSALNLPKRTPGLTYEEVKGGFEVPDSWTFGYLQNFGEFTRGKSKHRPRNDKKLFGGDFPFIQTGEVSRSNGIIKKYTNTYSEFGLAQSRLFPKGTLCITIAANIAETGILDFDACFPDSVVGYLPYKKLYTVEFAMFCLMTMQKDLEHFAPSTAQKNINLGILFEVPFPVPPKEEQTEIVKRVEHLFAKADVIEAQYQTLKTKTDSLPQAILAKAFKGELVEQLDTDGDAKVLLEEIQKLKASLRGTKQSVNGKKKKA